MKKTQLKIQLNEQEILESFKMKERKISDKQIFRSIAFEYRQNYQQGVDINILSKILSNMYYPNNTEEDIIQRGKLKHTIENAFSFYLTDSKYITEKKFIQAMQSIDEYQNAENNQVFLTKLFKRFDDDNDNYLDFNDFSNFMSRFEDKNLDTKELRALYEAISLKNVKGISYEAFMKYLTVKK